MLVMALHVQRLVSMGVIVTSSGELRGLDDQGDRLHMLVFSAADIAARVQAVQHEADLWEVDLPLWKRLPAYCSTQQPHALRFTGDAVYGGYVAFRARLATTLPDAMANSAYASPLLVTLASADGSMAEMYGHLETCVLVRLDGGW